MTGVQPIIDVRHVSKVYDRGRRGESGFRAVDNVSLSILKGESYGLVGESGSGKSTTARLIMRLVEKTSGEVLIDGTPIHDLSASALRDFRRKIQIVFQDPLASLNPRLTIGETLADCLRFHGLGTASSRLRAARDILDQVALGSAYAARYPHELSGGQSQRVGIARALILEPKIVVLDEPVSALDVSVQAQILNLLSRLQAERGLTYLFISHDLNVVRHFCDRVGIMQRGA
ncbi:MAG TPA: dipeptide/oligopeptide/nickel ABC transporter ATP-binding protein, partial [Pararhizobium sp.]|uniref:dipeptide/oligopeptide/nickel ABC transporter ATP-binding protein n=1 Tax=Pararhizobium sp. TaxID=1977563 RepID=UPI002BC0077F